MCRTVSREVFGFFLGLEGLGLAVVVGGFGDCGWAMKIRSDDRATSG